MSIDYENLKSVIEKTGLERWQTEKYALYQGSESGINKFEVHHLEWPIEEIVIKNLTYKYSSFEKLMTGQPNLVHWSNGVKVIAWNKEKLSKIE